MPKHRKNYPSKQFFRKGIRVISVAWLIARTESIWLQEARTTPLNYGMSPMEKKYGLEANFEVIVNMEKGNIEIET